MIVRLSFYKRVKSKMEDYSDTQPTFRAVVTWTKDTFVWFIHLIQFLLICTLWSHPYHPKWNVRINSPFTNWIYFWSKKNQQKPNLNSVLLYLYLMCIKKWALTMRYHLIPDRMAIIKKTRNNKCWWGCEKKGILMHCWWECKLVLPLWKTVWRFLKKFRIELPYDLAIPVLSIYLKKTKTLIQKDICNPHVHCSIIYNSQEMETT